MSDAVYKAYLKKHIDGFTALEAAQDKELARMYIEFAGKIKERLPELLGKASYGQQKMILNKLVKEAARLSNNFTKYLDKALLEAANLSTEANRYLFKGYQDALYDAGQQIKVTKVLYGIPKEAVAMIYDRIWTDGLMLSDRLWILDKATKGEIERIVMEAIITGKSASDKVLNESLMRLLNPDYKGTMTTLHGRRVGFESTRLLRTSRTEAFAAADKLANDKNPAIKKVTWRTARDTDVCDICVSNDGEDVEEVGYPPAHPQCRCTTIAEVEPIDKFVDRWIDFMKGGRHPDLNNWYLNVYKAA